MHSVYRIVNLINGKSYIGLTKGLVAKRWQSHTSNARRQVYRSLLGLAIRKYGEDMFRISILSSCDSRPAAAAEEVRLIALFKPEYNMTPGGEGTLGLKHTAEARAKISAAGIGRVVSEKTRAALLAVNTGRIVSPETRKKLSEINMGKTHSAETKAKLAALGVGRTLSSDVRKNMSAAQIKRASSPNYKPSPFAGRSRIPVCCTTDGNTFASVSAAAKFYGLSVPSVTHVCRGKYKHTGGYHFIFGVH